MKIDNIFEKLFKKYSNSKKSTDPVQSLLETLSNDKDDELKDSVESALLRISEKRADELLQVLCTYKKNTPKLSEASTAVLLRVIEFATASHLSEIEPATVQQCIDLSVGELIKITDYISTVIQKPAQEILLAMGRQQYCKQVMEALSKHLVPNQPAHFMIMHCMGTMATANTNDIINFIKPTLAVVLPTLAMIRQDHVKQSHAFAIGRFCEAVTEYETNLNEEDQEAPLFDISTEVSIAYDVLRNQWLGTREPKLCADILNALSFMFPLLPFDKVSEQSTKIVPLLINLSRRSDRLSVTQFLAAVIKTLIKQNPKTLDGMSDNLINSLFDLVCVSPDYEKPQTIKGHYEALRCFDLMSEIYSEKIMEMLLMQLRSNNERERIKSLLVITHLVSTNDVLVQTKVEAIVSILRSMLTGEKSLKIRMILLKTIVAFIQKGFLKDREFIKFLIRNCCRLVKPNTEHGGYDEYEDFHQACCKSMFILSSTVGMIDDLLKAELLQHFLNLEYTDACSTIAKCLSNLFGKNPELVPLETFTDDHEEEVNLQMVPCPESVFVRSLVLLGNFEENNRIVNILNFLKSYCPNLKKHLAPLWNDKIPGLLEEQRKNDEDVFMRYLLEFLTLTVKDLDDPKFAEILVNKLTDQMSLYPGTAVTAAASPGAHNLQCEFKIPSLLKERGMLLKLLGHFLCYVTDPQTVDAKIELIIATVKAEKIDKSHPALEFDSSVTRDASKALGYASRIHFDQLMKKILTLIIEDGPKKSSSGFFSSLHFIKDSQKETEVLKMRILIIASFGSIVENASGSQILKHIDERMVDYLCRQLIETRYYAIRQMILETFLNVAKIVLENAGEQTSDLKLGRDLIKLILTKIPMEANEFENVSLLPLILKLAAVLLQLERDDEDLDVNDVMHMACAVFFQIAQHLKSKFQSPQEDALNSYLAKHLNISLPELNLFIKTALEIDPLPSCLDDILSILNGWLKHANSEVRICAGHVLNAALDAYIKTVKIGCEAPSKFNQTGVMLGKIVPRCIDTNATVRFTSVEIVKRILEIACIYETLTIPDHNVEWMQNLQKIKAEVTTDDPKEIYNLANGLAEIIASRLSSLQHVQFTKQLLKGVNDSEQSSAIGASVVLKFFIQLKGGDMFHAIPELNKECLAKLKHCDIPHARSGILKALVALTKHHPKIMANEMLSQQLPYESSVIEFWHHVSNDADLSSVLLEYFLAQLSASPLYDSGDKEKSGQQVAAAQPFAIISALHAMFQRRDSVEFKGILKKHFAEIFAMLLTFVAVYTNVAPPTNASHNASSFANSGDTKEKTSKSKFGFTPNKELVKQNPCQIVLDTFRLFLDSLEMEQVSSAFSMAPHMGSSMNLGNFIEIMTPVAVALVNQLTINSTALNEVVTVLAKYIPSPYDGQRVAAIGMYSQLVPLQPCGEISSVIVLHLSSSLNDPNPLVRGLCIRGLSFIGNLTEHDSTKYSEMALAALLKGIDDSNNESLINIPLDSMRGVSRILKCLPSDKLEMFHISLAIRIRPFFENQNLEIREAAIVLFGDLCSQEESNSEMTTKEASENMHVTVERVSEALREQLYANLCSLILHLGETELQIVHACKVTLKYVCELLSRQKIHNVALKYLSSYGELHYQLFLHDFVRLLGEELPDHVSDFIDSCLPFLKSQWVEIRGNAAIVLGILSNFYPQSAHHNGTLHPAEDKKEPKSHHHSNHAQLDIVCTKISILLKDENLQVRVKAAEALGYVFGGI